MIGAKGWRVAHGVAFESGGFDGWMSRGGRQRVGLLLEVPAGLALGFLAFALALAAGFDGRLPRSSHGGTFSPTAQRK